MLQVPGQGDVVGGGRECSSPLLQLSDFPWTTPYSPWRPRCWPGGRGGKEEETQARHPPQAPYRCVPVWQLPGCPLTPPRAGCGPLSQSSCLTTVRKPGPHLLVTKLGSLWDPVPQPCLQEERSSAWERWTRSLETRGGGMGLRIPDRIWDQPRPLETQQVPGPLCLANNCTKEMRTLDQTVSWAPGIPDLKRCCTFLSSSS